MDILIGITIVFIIIVAVYVGYHAQQAPIDAGDGHDISQELEILKKHSESIKILQNYPSPKLIT